MGSSTSSPQSPRRRRGERNDCVEVSAAAEKKPALSAEPACLTLKEMVSGAQTTARAVRFYESERLIQTAKRSKGGHRLFESAELSKLQLIIDLRTCGFSIDEIREVLEAKAGCSSPYQAAQVVKSLLVRHLAELQRKVSIIERLGREFSASVKVLDRCLQCTDPRGTAACSTCDVPRLHIAPPSFQHIWALPATTKPKTTG